MRLSLLSLRSYSWVSRWTKRSYKFYRDIPVEVYDAIDWEWLTSGTMVRFVEDPPLGERLVGPEVAARFKSGAAQRLLVCRGRGLGDVLLLTPALREWRRRYPESTVGVAVDRGYRRFFSGLGIVDEALDFAEAYERGPWDVVANLNYYAEKSPFDTVEHRSVVFGRGLGLGEIQDLRLEYVVDESDRDAARVLFSDAVGPLVVVQMEASTAARCPSPAKMWELLTAMVKAGLTPVAVGGSLEVPPGTVDLQGKYNLVECAALLEQADVAVGLDSGLTHLANAVGATVVPIFGPGEPSLRVGGQPNCHPVQVCEWGGCEKPCKDHRPAACLQRPLCLERFPVSVVVEAVWQRLSPRPANM